MTSEKRLRTKVIGAKVTGEEYKQVQAAAKAQGASPSDWARAAIMDKLNGPREIEVSLWAIFSELIAVRMGNNSILHSLTRTSKMTEAEYKAIVTDIAGKHMVEARKRLEKLAIRTSTP